METHTIRGVGDVAAWIDSRAKLTGRASAVWWLALAGLFLDAFGNSAISAGLNPMQWQLGFTADQMAVLQATGSLVAIPVYSFAGWAADRWGRLPLVITSKVIVIAGFLLCALAGDLNMLLGGRVLVGMAFGFDFAIAMAYLAEMTPARLAPRLNLWQAVWYVAFITNLAITWLAWQVWFQTSPMPLDIWRFALLTNVCLAVILLILQLIYLPESPRWLVGRGRLEQAAKSLSRLYPKESFEAGELIETSAPESTQKRPSYSLIFRGIYLKRIVLASTVAFGQSLQYYGIGIYMAVISVVLTTDFTDPANPVPNFGAALLLTLYFNLFGLVGGLLSPLTGRKLGLRLASAWGFTGVTVVLLALGWIMSQVETSGMTSTLQILVYIVPGLFFLFHAAGPGPNGPSLAAFSFRSEVRSTATSFSQLIGSVGSVIGIYLFLPLADMIGYGPTIAWIAIVPAICAVICFMIKWEPTHITYDLDTEPGAPGLLAASPDPNQQNVSEK